MGCLRCPVSCFCRESSSAKSSLGHPGMATRGETLRLSCEDIGAQPAWPLPMDSLCLSVGQLTRVEFLRCTQQLRLGEVVLVHDDGSDHPPGYLRMLGVEPFDELAHLASSPLPAPHYEDGPNASQHKGNRPKVAVWVGFLAAPGEVLRVVRLVEMVLGLVRQDPRGNGSVHHRPEYRGLVVVDNDQPVCLLLGPIDRRRLGP